MATKKPVTSTKSAGKKVVKKTTPPAITAKPVKKATTSKAKPAAAKTTAVKKTAAKTTAAKASSIKNTASKASAAKATAKVSAKAPAAKKTSTKKSAPVDPSLELADAVVNGMLEKKAEHVVCLDLRNIENAICSFFIICEGNSDTQVEAIASSVEAVVKKQTGQRAYRSEGWENALWILVDYIDVVVHVFERETRQFYNLERLWADAEEIKYSEKGQRLN